MRSSPTSAILRPTENGERYELRSPTAMPTAGGFMWNQRMMIHVTNRGYATAQFMQPEPAKYSHGPNIEAKTFMQPEKNYFAHHPGRFVYVKDEETGRVFSAPYEPVRARPDRFSFSVGKNDIRWTTELLGLRVEMTLALSTHDISELWTVRVTNVSGRGRKISVYPHFTIGYMSWMNQSASWRPDLGGIVASSITPYQKSEDYWKNKELKDKTYFLCEKRPVAWEAMHAAFEGEGGLHAPSALQTTLLGNSDAMYETPTAVVQYREEITGSSDPSLLAKDVHADSRREYRFIFGPAKDDAEIEEMRAKYLSKEAFDVAAREYAAYIERGRGCLLRLETPDPGLDNFVNHWLARQVYYHGDVNRLSTDPQTRNYLQDNMGMSFIRPSVARSAFITALGQQEASGAMPDGIILIEGGTLKYINQVPHTDHCVWLPVTLEAYLSETADYALLDEVVVSGADKTPRTVFERFSRAMDWLLSDSARDARGLSYIAQGDWCDPMNMVGYKGKGVSAWLTIATAWALRLWADVCEQRGESALAKHFRDGAAHANEASNRHFWDGEWFSRGITDDGVAFGISSDKEGRMWLNPQSFAILGGAVDAEKECSGRLATILDQVEAQLWTPYGLQMFAPAFTAMREDVGRVTQKSPGSAENASVYNHAAAFYVHALYSLGGREAGRAFKVLRKMIPGPDEADFLRRGQLPVYIPNYYRGAWHQFPRTAGRSSQLFNTGTISWVYRDILEGLCGLKGDAKGLSINPQMPPEWPSMTVTRQFRGATFRVEIRSSPTVREVQVRYGEDAEPLPEPHIKNADIKPGESYRLVVTVPGEVVEDINA